MDFSMRFKMTNTRVISLLFTENILFRNWLNSNGKVYQECGEWYEGYLSAVNCWSLLFWITIGRPFLLKEVPFYHRLCRGGNSDYEIIPYSLFQRLKDLGAGVYKYWYIAVVLVLPKTILLKVDRFCFVSTAWMFCVSTPLKFNRFH